MGIKINVGNAKQVWLVRREVRRKVIFSKEYLDKTKAINAAKNISDNPLRVILETFYRFPYGTETEHKVVWRYFAPNYYGK